MPIRKKDRINIFVSWIQIICFSIIAEVALGYDPNNRSRYIYEYDEYDKLSLLNYCKELHIQTK